jgi:hypothetical protein
MDDMLQESNSDRSQVSDVISSLSLPQEAWNGRTHWSVDFSAGKIDCEYQNGKYSVYLIM